MNSIDKEAIKKWSLYLFQCLIQGIWIGSLIYMICIILGIVNANPVLSGWIFWGLIFVCLHQNKKILVYQDAIFLKILKTISVLLLFIIPIYLLIVVSPYPLAVVVNPINPVNIISIDNAIAQKYSNEIFPKSNETISLVIEDCKNDDPKTKLNKIFRWEIRDWHNPDWEPGTFWRSADFPTYLFYKGNMSKLLAAREYELSVFKQKNPEGIFYGDDPYWLAYNKVGACQELSNLFSFMANKAGIKSRTVQTIWHKWVEVEIDNRTMYYDPWCAVYHKYYNVNDENMTLSYKWFNSTEYFEENCESNALFLNWYDEFPYSSSATINYDIYFLSHKINEIF